MHRHKRAHQSKPQPRAAAHGARAAISHSVDGASAASADDPHNLRPGAKPLLPAAGEYSVPRWKDTPTWVPALSTIAMITYPMIATALHLDHVRAGIFLGGTIHDVTAQVNPELCRVAVAAAEVALGPRVSRLGRSVICLPAEGLDQVFKDFGAEWRFAGCSMCLGMNPDQLAPGERSASTSNRNFEGRQGKGARTHLVSPLVAAATAIRGTLSAPADLVDSAEAN